MRKTPPVRTKKLLGMTALHRVVMILWSYFYLSIGIIAFTQDNYGAFAAAIVLNILNMFIYYIYHKVAFKIFKLKDEE
jgi:hypothetical protein